MFGTTRIVKNGDKEKYVYSEHGIAFNGKGEWSSDNTARNVITFDVDNSLSSDTDNPKNNFLVLGEGEAFGINGGFGGPEKK